MSMMHPDGFNRVFIAPNALSDVRLTNRLVGRGPFETRTDDRYAFDPGINAVPMGSSLE
jgi:hypothetical protein